MARPATGKTPQRSMRIEAAIWDPAQTCASNEGRTMTDVVKELLVLYAQGAKPRLVPDPATSHEADPWNVINTIVREIPGANLGPSTDLQLAGELASDLLRALGVQPRNSAEK